MKLECFEEDLKSYICFQIQALLAATECKLAEARKQYDLMLEGKQLELSKHLKELSQRNDQVLVFHYGVS